MTETCVWHTDEPCPVCGTELLMTDQPHSTTVACPLCGWSSTWTYGPERTSDHLD